MEEILLRMMLLSKFLKKENINYTTFKCTTWLDCGRKCLTQTKVKRPLNTSLIIVVYSDLLSLLHGKLYRCPFAANAVNLEAIPKNSTDEVNFIR